FLFDLKSVNGVYVNGKRVDQKQEVRPGDKVLIGEQEMILSARSADKETKPHVPARRKFIETLHASDAAMNQESASARATARPYSGGAQDDGAGELKPLSDTKEELTFQGEALELLTGVADKVLALGRGEEAERILGTYMANLLDAAKAGAGVGPKTSDKAAIYATKLAAVTGKSSWLDFAITLFTILKRPLPGEVVDELYGLLRKTSGVNLGAVREYVAVLQSVQSKFGPAEKFLLGRIEGLERIASLR
ncbi:MAG TPA: FHA domain-containing protein, partial [Polyangiaceae bacterium]|nr:FHA domain-containing protein [Polyangiaceae bacterium]